MTARTRWTLLLITGVAVAVAFGAGNALHAFKRAHQLGRRHVDLLR